MSRKREEGISIQSFEGANVIKQRHEDLLVEGFEKDFEAAFYYPKTKTTEGKPVPIRPRYSPGALLATAKEDPMIMACTRSLSVNVGKTGYTLTPRIPVKYLKDDDEWIRTDTGDQIPKEMVDVINREYDRIKSFCDNLGLKFSSSSKLKSGRIRFLSQIGNCYWEVIRNNAKELIGFVPFKDQTTIRKCEEDDRPVQMKCKVIEGVRIKEVQLPYYFSRYEETIKKGKKRYYKEFQDQRLLDANTGEYIDPENMPDEFEPATEVVQFRTDEGVDYGDPYWLPNLLGVQTNKGARINNRETMNNGGVPKMAVLITNSKDANIAAEIKQNFRAIKQDGSKDMIMVVMLKPQTAGTGPAQTAVNPQIEFKPFSDLQEKEGMFLKLTEAGDKNTRLQYGLHELMLGLSDGAPSKATAYVVKADAEQQVYSPLRSDFDEWMNTEVFPEKGFKFWQYKCNGMGLKDSESIIKMLEIYGKYGGVTPDDLREKSEELVGFELEPTQEPWAQVPQYLANTMQQAQEEADIMPEDTVQELKTDMDPINDFMSDVLGPELEKFKIAGAYIYKPGANNEDCC